MQYPDLDSYDAFLSRTYGIRRLPIAWRAVSKAIYGQPLTPKELKIFLKLSGGIHPPPGGIKRLLCIAGRRSGKSLFASRLAFYEATQRDHTLFLEPGQRGSISLISPDRRQSLETCRYIQGLAGLPKLKAQYVANIPVESVVFRNGLAVDVVTASETAVRSRTAVVAVLDEAAFLDVSDGSDTDGHRIVSALTPSLLVSGSAPDRRFIAVSSAAYKSGWAWEIFDSCFGKEDAAYFCLSGSTLDFRPDLDPSEIEADCVGDPAKKSREYESVWGSTAGNTFFLPEVVEALPPPARAGYLSGVSHRIAIDAALTNDWFAVSVVRVHAVYPAGAAPDSPRQLQTDILHVERWKGSRAVPLDLAVCAAKIRAIALQWNVTAPIIGDQHECAGVEAALKAVGLKFTKVPWSGGNGESAKKTRFDLVRAEMMGGRFAMCADADLRRELCEIVEEPLKSGGSRIRGVGRHDDLAHCVVLGASELLIPLTNTTKRKSAQIADCNLTQWEKNQRDMQARQMEVFDLIGGGGGFGGF